MAFTISYPGVTNAIQADYTLGYGTAPGQINIELQTPDGLAAVENKGDCVFSDGINQITIPNCRLVDLQKPRSVNGFKTTVVLEDERHLLRGSEPVDGRYNLSTADGGLDPDTEKSPKELAGILREKIGGILDGRDALMDLVRPEIQWDAANPLDELEKLCSEMTCVLCYTPGFGFKIHLRGTTTGEPGVQYRLSEQPTATVLKKPEKFVLLGGREEVQAQFELEAVGLDTDGALKPLDELSYKPAGGWGADLFYLCSITDDETRRIAEETVYRWYRIKEPISVYAGVMPDVPEWMRTQLNETAWKRKWLLPLLDKLVETVDYDGKKQTRKSEVLGEFAPQDTVENVVIVDGWRWPRVDIGYSLEKDTGLVKFSRPVVKYTAGNPGAAALYLKCTFQADRYRYEEDYGGDYGKRVLYHDDIVFQRILAGVAPNWERALNQAVYYLNAAKAEYEPSESDSITCQGLFPIYLDGQIRQITWSVGTAGATTRFSKNTEHDWRYPKWSEIQNWNRYRRAADKSDRAPRGTGYAGEVE